MASAISLALLGAVAVALSLQLPIGTLRAPDTGFFPLVLGLLLVGLATAHGVQAWRRRAGAAPARGAAGATGRVLAFLAVVVVTTALLKPLGYVVSSFLLVLGLLRLLGVRRWDRAALVAFSCAAAAHVVFVQWLRIPLPAGPLGF